MVNNSILVTREFYVTSGIIAKSDPPHIKITEFAIRKRSDDSVFLKTDDARNAVELCLKLQHLVDEIYSQNTTAREAIKIKDVWETLKAKRNCDILLVDIGNTYCTHFEDAEKLHHDFDFCDILMINDRCIFATFPKRKISSILDYYKSKGTTVKILPEGK